MSKRAMFWIAAAVLAVGWFVVQAGDASSASSQAATISQMDQAGQSTASQVADLKSYVATHMGTSVTVNLTGSYDRAKTAADASAKAASAAQSANAAVYAAAQQACMGKTDSITQARCNAAYLQTHLSQAAIPTPMPEPVLAAYQLPLAAPIWTPDVAGALLLGALIALVMGFVMSPRRR